MAARMPLQRPPGGQLRQARATSPAAPSGQLVASPDQLAARPAADARTVAAVARYLRWTRRGVAW